MTAHETYRWRKITDINREHALYELLDGDAAMLNAGFTDDGIFEVAFNPGIGSKVMAVEKLLRLLDEGRLLAERER